jgi:ornithine--oxo-acid transaminase
MTSLANNYHRLDITLATGSGSWVTDTSGDRYIDCLLGYSAVNFGHGNPELIAAAHAQLDRLTLTSRAVDNDQLGEFADRVTSLTGFDAMLPMNTGAEAVETALKTSRKWAYDVKGVPTDGAEIIVMADAFHGRTTTIISFSTDPGARTGFGPYTPGFVVVPYGDAQAVADAITPRTAAVLVEPVQGEAGIIIPPESFLPDLRRLCDENQVLLVIDEIQAGLGRCGATLAQDVSGVRADVTTLGKALGGGIVPTSAAVARRDVMDVMTPGIHGSTFGGNPLASAVGIAVTKLLATGEYQQRARELSPIMSERAKELVGQGLLTDVRCLGLWMGVDVHHLTGRELSKRLASRGVLAKETHGNTIRFAPPLTISEDELHQVMDALEDSLRA